MNESVKQKKDNDTKKILTIFILIVALMFGTTGATYAYFALTATDNTATGTTANTGLSLSVTRVTPTDTKWNASSQKMVPQLDSALGSAMNETNSCVDGNNNVICQVYKISIENVGTSTVRLRGAVYFTLGTGAVYTNLYWKQVTGANVLGENNTYKYSTLETTNSTTANTENATLIDNLLLTAKDSTTGSGTDYQEYYVIVWISETNTNQATTDRGKWNMNVSFKDSSGIGGITSTITS